MIDVYLACPYSAKHFALQTQRAIAADKAAARLIRAGFLTYSPISHSHGISLHGKLPGDWKFWKEYDEEFIVFARVVVVLTLDGYKTSEGVNEKIKIAEECARPVLYWNGDDESFLRTLKMEIDEIKKRETEKFAEELNAMEKRLDELEKKNEL